MLFIVLVWPLSSPRRKPGSSVVDVFWIPAFAGKTTGNYVSFWDKRHEHRTAKRYMPQTPGCI